MAAVPPSDTPPPRDEIPAWIDRVVDVAGALGMNRVRVRWKLQRRVNEWRSARNRRTQAMVHVRYEHRVCPRCTAVNDRGESVCHRCDTPLQTRAVELFGRLGVHVPVLRSASALLGLAIAVAYARTALVGHDVVSISSQTLVAFGGNLPAGADGGEWWRVATSVFLHAGLWHLAFNLLSLANVGPMIEELYGRRVMAFLFVATGIVAALGTRAWWLAGVGIGASGAIMGLIGVATAAGHRMGTTRGRTIRNAMLRWVVYVLVFGYFIGADNVAHAVGFVVGAAFGLLVPPIWITQGRGQRVGSVLGAIGIVVALATVAATLAPLSSMPVWHAYGAFDDASANDAVDGDADLAVLHVHLYVCAARDRGDTDVTTIYPPDVLTTVCNDLADLKARCTPDGPGLELPPAMPEEVRAQRVRHCAALRAMHR